ncbi:GntR family transcriptional regulator [Alicyclobacillus fastidiosus]|uniref:GntR family transcriptional regulator n=1 Tax=Alicyclobacillus fastidiosus TaxID=392011 RepID=A0ABV5AH16_9BACL|nr:GntR family transcriptional regulator [Alicyclobacillus fastidiosus]WEH09667.1 GntR family transcriptional regulator [Alicyclobacillus fastidiosus]
MDWQLDTGSGVPIYLQLKQQIIQKVVRGEWGPGHQLPTVRQLAVDVRVNVNTVSRVYSEVEREGFIQTHQGKGTFVSAKSRWAGDVGDRMEAVERFAEMVMEMARAQGIGRVELIEVLQEMDEKRS